MVVTSSLVLVCAEHVFSLWHGARGRGPVPFRRRLARPSSREPRRSRRLRLSPAHRSRPQGRPPWQVMCKASTTSKHETFSATPWPSPVILTCERHAGQRKPLAGRACGTRSGGRGSPIGRVPVPSGTRAHIQAFRSFFPAFRSGSSTMGFPGAARGPPWLSSLPRFFPPPAQRPKSRTIAGRRRARSSCGG